MMKSLFWFGIILLILFEIANVYFIMPMPGSQRINSINAAYFLYKWRWIFRCCFILSIIIGLFFSPWKRKWVLAIPIAFAGAIVYIANFKMAADAMFKQPEHLSFASSSNNQIDSNRLIIGISHNGESKAYPIRFLGYHHLIQDTLGGKIILVTYCTVCRTGRAFEPIVQGKHRNFRLVGMDHFNAMMEDDATKSWWRQVTGEAIAGKLKGDSLPEVFSLQTSLGLWLQLHPESLIMQADSLFIESYSKNTKYEDGLSRESLTGTDSTSWKDKSWVIGIKVGKDKKAYDWNKLKTYRVIHDNIGKSSIVIILANDDKSFFAFEQPEEFENFSLKNDTIFYNNYHFTIDGKGIDTNWSFKRLPAYQEFWHSWQTFNPGTEN